MAVIDAERFLPPESGMEHAFDVPRTMHPGPMDLETLQGLLETRQPQLFSDWLRSGVGWLANRSKSPIIRRTGAQAWALLERGPDAVVLALTNDLLGTASQISGTPPIEPPNYVPEGLICGQSPLNRRIHLIVPTHFFEHAVGHPTEAMVHLAGAMIQMRDLDRVTREMTLNPGNFMGVMAEMSMRSFAANAQIFLEAGDTYVPSSETYARLRDTGRQNFPHGIASLPLELQF